MDNIGEYLQASFYVLYMLMNFGHDKCHADDTMWSKEE